MDRRIMDAAMDLFGEVGWSGFTIDAVARVAGVGKASIYLRWTGKEDLLTEAAASRFAPIAQIDTGSVRGDLLELAHLLLDLFGGRHGLAARRMTVESHATPGVAERWKAVRESQVRAARAIVKRGIDRGELRPETPMTLLLDMLSGAAINHAIATPPHLRARVEQRRRRYAEELVDHLLAPVKTGRAHPHVAGRLSQK